MRGPARRARAPDGAPGGCALHGAALRPLESRVYSLSLCHKLGCCSGTPCSLCLCLCASPFLSLYAGGRAGAGGEEAPEEEGQEEGARPPSGLEVLSLSLCARARACVRV